jgi:CDP-diacylglycerol pyrophosphatase
MSGVGGKMKKMKSRSAVFAAAIILLTSLAAGQAQASDPDALWKIVDGHCVPNSRAGAGPAPCALVDLAAGYAVLKDIRGATQFLLIPTARVSGIESPSILAPDAPNYWQEAWQARRFVIQKAGRDLPRQGIALAINAQSRRSQNQLHIHIDCIRVDVKVALAAKAGEIGLQWTALTLPPAGHGYRVRRISSPDLAENPFRLVAETLPGAAAHMGEQSLVVVGAIFADGQEGFYLLADQVEAAEATSGWGEELQDHACAMLKDVP